ncbi:hypothetical protein MBLNU457_4769t1 [Dothideomycetes sp. NU457]
MASDLPDEVDQVDGPSIVNGDHAAPNQAPQHAPDPKETEDVLHSDIGLSTLLDRLKQSIASARDFAAFLKKRSSIEEEHSKDLKRLAKTTQDAAHRAESRQGTYARQIESSMRLHDRMADNGMQFALSLHQMHEDLTELSNNVEKGRKNWKHEGMDAEKRASDAEVMMQKAKAKYDSLAEDYDRAKTGDIKGSRRIMMGTKSSAQHEEDLLRKLQVADSDYSTKVQAAKAQREQLLNLDRPKAIRNLQELIRECDSALTLQLQKFATFNEKLLLGNGILITPLPSEGASNQSLRDIMDGVDNDKDLHDHIVSQRSRVPPKPSEIKYEQHPTLFPKQQTPTAAAAPTSRQTSATYQEKPSSAYPQQPASNYSQQPASTYPQEQSSTYPQEQSSTYSRQPSSSYPHQPPHSPVAKPPPATDREEKPLPQAFQNLNVSTPYTGPPSQQPSYTSATSPQSPQYSFQSYQSQQQRQAPPQYQQPPYPSGPDSIRAPSRQGPPGSGYGQVNNAAVQPPNRAQSPMATNLPPPVRPVFGLDLEQLFQRDGTAVPMVVYQCMQAVDLFGLDVEGIYRLSGNNTHIQQLKAVFDNDSSRVDFRNPAAFHHDVNAVAGLLKQFFRDLPDPLFTRERYNEFISAARIDDDIVRRDTLHAIINGLPDANYATMRALVIHLNRVQEHSNTNRMSSSNVAICLAPSLMGAHTGSQIADAGLQARVLDTILANTYQIFDED